MQGTVSRYSEASAHLKSPGDAVLIERGGRLRLLLLSCPCGCGEHFPINLDSSAGSAWRIYRNRHSGLSLFPSVWRENGCMSHYIIWHDKIFLFGRYEDDLETSPQADIAMQLVDAVRDCLPKSKLISFSEIAEILNAVPWDVLIACRQLVRTGFASEGRKKQRGRFRRI